MNSAVYGKISISIDNDELNPLLRPEEKGHLTVTGRNGKSDPVVIPNESVRFFVKTIFTCDDSAVADVNEHGEVIPLHGGLVKISAEYICGGEGRRSEEISVIVRPFYHEYHRTIVFKLFMAMEPFGSLLKESDGKRDDSVYIDFEETLDLIRRFDAITNEMPKIVYLVGWQKGGHDHLYPAFNEVNPRLKRACDADARESMRWLMREAKKYHTDVSVHINLFDGYEDSPLWNLYREKHIFAEHSDAVPAGEDAFFKKYGIRYGRVEQTPLWNSGEFEKRMNELFALLPEILDSHTIHIDNWRCEACPELGISKTDEENTTRKIFEWLRERGLDATSEGSFHGRTEPMTGLQPMSWWDAPYAPSEIPLSLYCGGRRSRSDTDPRFGDTILVEEAVRENVHRKRDLVFGLQDEYCLYTLPWEFLGHFRLLSFDGTVATYSDGVKAQISGNGEPEIFWNSACIREGTTMFVPLLFRKDREIIMYSFRDSNIYTRLPKGWEDIDSLDMYYLDPFGRNEPVLEIEGYPLKNGGFLEYYNKPRCTYLVKPHGEHI